MVQSIMKAGGHKPKIKGKTDVAYVIDAMKSMPDCLENSKASLTETSREIDRLAKEKYRVAEPDVAFNVIGFRDLFEDEES